MVRTTSTKPKKWTSGCTADMLLTKFLRDETIKENDRPKVARTTHPEFQKYTLDTFRTHLNKKKKELRALSGEHCKYFHYTF